MICTLPSSSMPTSVTRSRPGISTYPNARCERKACSPRPVRSSGLRAVLSLRTVWECSARIDASSAGTDPVPSTSATDRGNRGTPRSTMVSSSAAAAVGDGGCRRGLRRRRQATGGDSNGGGGGMMSLTDSGMDRRWQFPGIRPYDNGPPPRSAAGGSSDGSGRW